VSEDLFWSAAEGFVERDEAQPGTIMSHPCLRTPRGGRNGEGEFVAMPYGDVLVVKLTAERVEELVGDGEGAAFNLTGRTFREWVTIETRDVERWRELIEEGLETARRRTAG
jgi:hypothetical protein